MKLPYDAILFDFDGVLLDTVDIKTQGFIKLFKPFGSEIVKRVVKHHLKNGGISRSEKIKYYYNEFLHKQLTQHGLDVLCAQYSSLTLKPSLEASWIEGAQEFLESNYKDNVFYIVSGIASNDLDLIVKKRKMNKYFVGVYGSPPEKKYTMEKIIRKNYYNPTKLLYIGDSYSDWEASKVVSIPFIGVTDISCFPPYIKTIPNFKKGIQ